MDRSDSELTFLMREHGQGDRRGIAEPLTAPGTPETPSPLRRRSQIETDDDDETTATEGLGEELERELSAMLTESPSPIPSNRRALEGGGRSPTRALIDCESNIDMCGGANANLQSNVSASRRRVSIQRHVSGDPDGDPPLEILLKGRPTSPKVSEHAEVSAHADEGGADEKGGLTPFSDFGLSLSESKPADPANDVSTVIDAQEENLPPCGAAGNNHPISEEDPTDVAVAMNSDEYEAGLSSIPNASEFWVEFRKAQRFYRQL